MNLQFTNDRLLLRPLAESDFAAVRAYESCPEVMRYLGGCKTDDEVRDELALAERDWSLRGGHRRFAITLKDTEMVIGDCGLILGGGGAGVDYKLARHEWGNGYAPEAARAVMDYGFRKCQFGDIVAAVWRPNTLSKRVLEKLGMRCVGCNRGAVKCDGKPCDQIIYRVTKSEWEALQTASGT